MFKPYSKSVRSGAGGPEGPPRFRQLARGVKSRLKPISSATCRPNDSG